MSKANVLVTGCAGYIGTILCQYLLQKNYTVWGMDSGIWMNESAMLGFLGDPNFTFYPADVRHLERVKPFYAKADVIIPLAAMVGAPACDKSPAFAKETNQDAIINMMGCLSKNQRVVYPNTNSGYGQTDGNSFCTENDPLTPISLYGRTKCEAEKAVLDHPWSATLRLATVFGTSPRMRFDLMVNDFTERLVNERKIKIFEPHFCRNFVHVRDVARVFEWMVAGHEYRGPFNVGLPNANVTKHELAKIICNTLAISDTAIAIGDGADPDKRNYIVSNDKLLATGFAFQHSLEDGVWEVAQAVSLLTPAKIRRMRNV